MTSNHTAILPYRSLLIIVMHCKLSYPSQSSLQLEADASISSAVITLTADDPDSGLGGKVNYTILGIAGSILSEHSDAFRCMNESNGTFRIDEYTGTLRVARTLAALCVYKVTIRAMDHGCPPLYSVVSIEIETGNATDLGIPTTIAIVSQEGLSTCRLIHSFIHSFVHSYIHSNLILCALFPLSIRSLIYLLISPARNHGSTEISYDGRGFETQFPCLLNSV